MVTIHYTCRILEKLWTRNSQSTGVTATESSTLLTCRQVAVWPLHKTDWRHIELCFNGDLFSLDIT